MWTPVLCRRFVGRKAELELLFERHRHACAGSGAAVLVAGEAGVGKSRLTSEFIAALRDASQRAFVGCAVPYAQTPLGAFLGILRSMLAEAPVGESSERVRMLLAHTRTRQESQETAASGFADRLELLDAIVDLLGHACASAPLVIVVEDLHYADDASQALVQHIVRAVPRLRVVLVATYRSDELPIRSSLRGTLADIERLPAAWRLPLSPLSTAQMREFVSNCLEEHPDIAPATAEEVIRLAEGNPLFAEELLKSALEHQTSGAPALPLTISQAVEQRLRYFKPAERTALAYAAVIGRHFRAGLLEHLLKWPAPCLARVAQRAIEQQLMIEERDVEVRYAFRHAVIREAVYATIPAAERRALHLRIAKTLEGLRDSPERVAELAYHFAQASIPEKAIGYAIAAGDAAVAMHADADAVRWYERALELQRSTPEPALHQRLGESYQRVGRLWEARASYERAADLFEHGARSEDAARSCLYAATACWDMGDVPSAHAFVNRILDRLAGVPESPYRFSAFVQHAFLDEMVGEPESALQWLERAAKLQGERRPRDIVAFHAVEAGAHAVQGDASAALAEYEMAVDAAARYGQRLDLLRCLGNAGEHLALLGQREDALRMFERAASLAREGVVGRYSCGVMLVQYAAACMTFGLLDRARALLNEALELDVQLLTHAGALFAATAIPLALAVEDDELLARCTSERVLENARRERHPAFPRLATAFLELYTSRGRYEQARSLASESVDSALSGGTLTESAWSCLRACLYVDERRLDGMQQVLVERVRRFPNRADVRACAKFVRAVACERFTPAQREPNAAQEAGILFSALQWPMHAALALEHAGQKRGALERYRQIGASREVRRLEALLTPVNRRGRPKTALTAREHEIALLVAQGKSNRAIAQALVIGERTVETHVASLLEKLGAARRAEVAERLTKRIATF